MLATITKLGPGGTPIGQVGFPFGVTHLKGYRQQYRVAEDALQRYELYVGEGAPPDLTAPPAATSTTLPINHTPSTPGPGLTIVLYSVVRLRTRYNISSLNQHPVIMEIDENMQEVRGPISKPELQRVLDGPAGSLQAWARYAYVQDRHPADTWELYAEVGVDPDPDIDILVATDSMGLPPGVNRSWRATADGLVAGTLYHVMAVARRSSDGAYAVSDVIQITLAELLNLAAGTTAMFGGEDYELQE